MQEIAGDYRWAIVSQQVIEVAQTTGSTEVSETELSSVSEDCCCCCCCCSRAVDSRSFTEEKSAGLRSQLLMIWGIE